jgi:hypothetical protein
VERLLGIEESRPDIRYGTNWEEPEYVEHGPTELFGLWDDDALTWAGEAYEQTWFKEARTDYLEIERRLTNEPVGPERSRLVNRKFQLMKFEDVETGK